MARISKKTIDQLAPNGKPCLIWDGDIPGFGLRVGTRGTVTYILQYRFEGRIRRYKIGRHGAPWTPELARQEARKLLGEVASGRDPQAWRFEDRAKPTVGELCTIYVDEGM